MESMAKMELYMKLAGNNVCFYTAMGYIIYNDNNMVKFCFVIFVTFSTFILTIFLFRKKNHLFVQNTLSLKWAKYLYESNVKLIYLFLFLMILVRCNKIERQLYCLDNLSNKRNIFTNDISKTFHIFSICSVVSCSQCSHEFSEKYR